MSAPWELNHRDDSVILTMDVADSPIAELRLSEIYDVKTSSMNDDYLVVLHNYIALQLKTTVGLCDWSKIYLLGSRFIPLHCRANGDTFSLRKPTLERLIQQTLQSRLNTCSPVSVSILIRFKTFDYTNPRRLDESPRIPPKIGGGWTRAHILYLNVEPVIPLLPISDTNKIGVTVTACVALL